MNDSDKGLGELSRTLLLSAVGLGLFGLGVLVGARFVAPPAPPAPRLSTTVTIPAPRPTVEPPSSTETESYEWEHLPPFEEIESPGPVGVRVALVIDDLGREIGDIEALGALDVPVTMAVLPFEVLTSEVVAEVDRRGAELICHLPMEPQSGANPGPGALTSDMTPQQLGEATRLALAAVPGAVGVNNHMGSSLSASTEAMQPVLEVVRDQGLFFLDSRTSAASVGYQMALQMGVAAAERQVFLDTELTVEAIDEQFDRLLWLARERGEAVAIGHPHRATLEVLARRVPEALAEGYEFVPLSFLLDRAAPPE